MRRIDRCVSNLSYTRALGWVLRNPQNIYEENDRVVWGKEDWVLPTEVLLRFRVILLDLIPDPAVLEG